MLLGGRKHYWTSQEIKIVAVVIYGNCVSLDDHEENISFPEGVSPFEAERSITPSIPCERQT